MMEHNVNPLGRKIVAAILGTTLIALVLAFGLNIIPTVYSYRAEAVEKVRSLTDLMAGSLVASIDFEDAEAARENLATLSLVPDVMGAAVILADGTVFASYGSVPTSPVVHDANVVTTFSGLTVVSPIPAGNPGCAVVVAASLDGQWAVLQCYLLSGAVIFIGVFIFCFKMAGGLRRKLGDPLHELTTVVHDISQSRDYSRRVEYESDDELGVLVTEFNSMLEKIEQRDVRLSRHREILEQRVEERTMQLQANQLELLQNNKQLFMEIRKRAQAEMIKEEVERINRHDLKSGLSLVIGYPELLLKEGDLDERQEKLIKRIRAAGYRMLDMIRNHLDMFKMEKDVYVLNSMPIDLVEILCELEEEFMPQITNSGVQLSIAINGREAVGDESFFVSGETPLLRTMCRNLVQNAIEASSLGDTVSVSLEDHKKKSLIVANTAPVPTEIRQRFFEKYVTSGKENGTGLGTYFAALIARTHGANITMKTSAMTGTVMTVVFRENPMKGVAVSGESVGVGEGGKHRTSKSQ